MDRVPAWIRLLGVSVWTVALVAALLRPAGWPERSDRSTMDVLALDPFRTAAHTVAAAHARDQAVTCLLRAAVWEPDTPDAARFADPVKGDAAPGGGRWLDIRAWSELAEPLGDRLALCATKGFDGVYLIDLDSWTEPTGFPLTRGDQLRFNTALVQAAHDRGLRVTIRPSPDTPMPPGLE